MPQIPSGPVTTAFVLNRLTSSSSWVESLADPVICRSVSGSEVRTSFPRHSQGKLTSDRTGEFWEPCWTDPDAGLQPIRAEDGGRVSYDFYSTPEAFWVRFEGTDKVQNGSKPSVDSCVSAVLLNRWGGTQKWLFLHWIFGCWELKTINAHSKNNIYVFELHIKFRLHCFKIN